MVITSCFSDLILGCPPPDTSIHMHTGFDVCISNNDLVRLTSQLAKEMNLTAVPLFLQIAVILERSEKGILTAWGRICAAAVKIVIE